MGLGPFFFFLLLWPFFFWLEMEIFNMIGQIYCLYFGPHLTCPGNNVLCRYRRFSKMLPHVYQFSKIASPPNGDMVIWWKKLDMRPAGWCFFFRSFFIPACMVILKFTFSHGNFIPNFWENYQMYCFIMAIKKKAMREM